MDVWNCVYSLPRPFKVIDTKSSSSTGAPIEPRECARPLNFMEYSFILSLFLYTLCKLHLPCSGIGTVHLHQCIPCLLWHFCILYMHNHWVWNIDWQPIHYLLSLFMPLFKGLQICSNRSSTQNWFLLITIDKWPYSLFRSLSSWTSMLGSCPSQVSH